MLVVSVQDLKGKIIVKGKKELAVGECSSSTSDLSSSDEEASRTEGKPPPKNGGQSLQPSVSKLSPELSELVVYTRSVHFKSFEQAARNPASELSSFSESEALRHIKDSGMMCVCHLTYMYPTCVDTEMKNK